jgi:hypothetical protein
MPEGEEKVSMSAGQSDIQDTRLGHLLDYLTQLRGAIDDIDGSSPRGQRRDHISRTVAVLEAELLCEQGSWEHIEDMFEVGVVVQSETHNSPRSSQCKVTPSRPSSRPW